jgi:hypothetical protein
MPARRPDVGGLDERDAVLRFRMPFQSLSIGTASRVNVDNTLRTKL